MAAKITLKPGKEKRVYTLHPWIFKSDIDQVDAQCLPGDTVDIMSSKGRFLARGYYNPNSQIALRIMTYHEDEAVDRALIFRRIHEAVEYRRSFADLKSCRVVFAESDRLPALIVDAFDDILVLQCLALGMEKAEGNLMRRKPRATTDGIFSHGAGLDMVWQGIYIAIVEIAAYVIGFWLEHRDDLRENTSSYQNYAVSVDQIEEWTGFDFFANLPEALQNLCEDDTDWADFRDF